jgi:hypothetical protein
LVGFCFGALSVATIYNKQQQKQQSTTKTTARTTMNTMYNKNDDTHNNQAGGTVYYRFTLGVLAFACLRLLPPLLFAEVMLKSC